MIHCKTFISVKDGHFEMFTIDNVSMEPIKYFIQVFLKAGDSYLGCWLQVVCHPWHELHQSGKTHNINDLDFLYI